MNVSFCIVRLRPAAPRTLLNTAPPCPPCPSRTFTSHRRLLKEPLSKSTSDLLDQLEREARRQGKMPSGAGASGGLGGGGATGGAAGVGADGMGNVGPFPMGVGLGSGARSKTWNKWSDLSAAGKVGRVTRQTGNLTIVLFGAGLFCVLTYALTSELFAKNSPTVLHNEAIKMIQNSQTTSAHLLSPLSFTHTPGSSSTRHSAPVQSQIVRNGATGREHLVLRFWVHGRGLGEPEEVGVWGWIKGRGRDAVRLSKRGVEKISALAGLSDEEQASSGAVVAVDGKEVHPIADKEEAGSWWGIFGALRPSPGRGSGHGKVTMGRKELPPAGTYKTGEARADYVKDETTQVYRLLTLTLDLPSHRASSSIRQRAIIFWGDEAEVRREGLLEGSGATRLAW